MKNRVFGVFTREEAHVAYACAVREIRDKKRTHGRTYGQTDGPTESTYETHGTGAPKTLNANTLIGRAAAAAAAARES